MTNYLIRIDDICATMNWTAWDIVEDGLSRGGVKPILAVVPQNRDPQLIVGRTDAYFWDRARAWQEARWAIALHGFEHRYVTRESGLVGINARSEFAGLSLAAQLTKLKKSMEIFADQGITPRLWVAPSHSFDKTTLIALQTVGIDVISDGLWPYPRRDHQGITWVPQQLWRLRWMPFGLWTVCVHLNRWSETDAHAFVGQLEAFRARIVDLETALDRFLPESLTWMDRAFATGFLKTLQLRRAARILKARSAR